MTADSTLFSDNDLTEPDYSGQVVATSVRGSGTYRARNYNEREGIKKLSVNFEHHTRRMFQRLDKNSSCGIWADIFGNRFLFTDLVDIVIINRGVKL